MVTLDFGEPELGRKLRDHLLTGGVVRGRNEFGNHHDFWLVAGDFAPQFERIDNLIGGFLMRGWATWQLLSLAEARPDRLPEPPRICSARLNGIMAELRRTIDPEAAEDDLLRRCLADFQFACTEASKIRAWGQQAEQDAKAASDKLAKLEVAAREWLARRQGPDNESAVRLGDVIRELWGPMYDRPAGG